LGHCLNSSGAAARNSDSPRSYLAHVDLLRRHPSNMQMEENMAHILRAADRPVTKSRTIRFEGEAYGTPISFFAVDNEPGQGPGLHTHPYPETWVVRRGRAEVIIGDERFEVGPGDIAVAPANTPHKFTNLGPERLDIVCIHAAGVMEQVDLE
jgi:mannose-6-phosphate isomerase-like protein (cupin superfamily)